MKKDHTLKIICTFYFFLCAFFVDAQRPGINTLQQLITSIDSFNARLPAEQLYLHFDKNDYAIGDTVWFKAYLLQRSSHAYSPLSGILYVELISDSGHLVKRMSFPAAYGLSWGQISLDTAEVAQGNYSIRAYTNWMQNFGHDYFYHRPVSISAPLTTNWLIKENHSVVPSGDNNTIDFTLQLTGTDDRPGKQKDVDLKIFKGKKVLYRENMRTSSDGVLNGKFSIPSNTPEKEVTLVVQDKINRAKKSIVPLLFNRPQNIDLRFMPESGYMVAGLTSKIGFKAISENGLGTEVQGKIVNSKNIEVASFKSFHRGMGVFQFTPANNETYSAIVILPDGNTKRFTLPSVKNSGIVLQFENEQNSDSIRVRINISPDIVGTKSYSLIGLSRGVVCYAASIFPRNTEINLTIAKSIFPSGIAHFTFMDMTGQPVNDRMLFIAHSDNLSLDIQPLKNNFSPRDSVPLHIKVTDNQGKPVRGSFSISVTDDTQVKTDNGNAENIVTRMLLTADLKGNIESPDYYFNNTDRSSWQALDALLLTQGWIGYDWEKLIKPVPPAFIAEPEFSVRGKVTNLFNSPINKAHVILMALGSRREVRDTVTDKKGEFVFTNFSRLDSLTFFLDARNKKEKKFGVGLTVNEFKPAEIKSLPAWNTSPWYVNSDSTIVNYTRNKERLEAQLYQSGKYKRLQEVKIIAKKMIKGSLNLNGSGNADQVIDEAEIEKDANRNKNLLQLLREKVKGFTSTPRPDDDIYRIYTTRVLFVIDGISLRDFGSARETLEYLDAADVKGIEVMYRLGYSGMYKSRFLSVAEQMTVTEVAFIEITTRSGNGVFFRRSPGVLLYKPVPITLPVQFYSPAYPVKNNSEPAQDLRSTIYWNPNLVTDANGETDTRFYAADTPATYTVTIQGSDINGSVGYKIQKITIRNIGQ